MLQKQSQNNSKLIPRIDFNSKYYRVFFKENDLEMPDEIISLYSMFLYRARNNSLLEICIESKHALNPIHIKLQTFSGSVDFDGILSWLYYEYVFWFLNFLKLINKEFLSRKSLKQSISLFFKSSIIWSIHSKSWMTCSIFLCSKGTGTCQFSPENWTKSPRISNNFNFTNLTLPPNTNQIFLSLKNISIFNIYRLFPNNLSFFKFLN